MSQIEKEDVQIESGEESNPPSTIIAQELEEHPQEKKKKSKQKVKSQKKKQSMWAWPIKILIFTIVMSFSVTVFSEFMLTSAGLVVSILILVPLLIVSVLSDMIGVAGAAADIYPFRSMASRKMRGAKESIKLIKNAEKVSSICNDVIGDVCGIISGAIGASIVVKIVTSQTSNITQIFIAAGVSAVIAGLTVFGKAIAKSYAINQSTKIVSVVGKILSVFSKKVK